MGSVRAIVPDTIKDEQIFQPLETALARYPKERTELIIGAATATDFAAKTVTVQPAGAGAAPRTLPYDELVLATGARAASPDVPWKAAEGYDEVRAQLQRTRERVAAARHIVVAGAGATGVEVAAELGFAYGAGADRKEVVLLSATDEILDGDVLAGSARGELAKLHVSVRTGARVAGATVRADGKTELALDGGETLVTDLYLPTFGLTPNTEYLDAAYLDGRKNVAVDEFHRVKGAEHVWAAGDIISVPRAGFMITRAHAGGVGKNVGLALLDKPPVPVKGPAVDMVVVATGRSRGVGRIGASFRMLSIMAWMGKGRTLAIQMLPGYIDGSVA